MAVERRLAFGGVAELYERLRPSYPEALVDDVLEFAGTVAGDPAVEVGAGTGKATALFARRGLRVLALEPDPEMASVAARRLAALPRVSIERIEFESWQPAERFRLLFSAQAWHWISPQVRYARARQALADGGAVALFWNRPVWDETPLRDELDRIYTRLAPGSGSKAGPMNPAGYRPEHWMTEWDAELAREAGLSGPEHANYPWRARYTSREYVDLLLTHSDHIVLEPRRREALLSAVRDVIDAHGGRFELPYTTRLVLARAVGAGSESLKSG